jgi:glucose-1-phosphate cytidylyltransferase
MEKQAIDVIIFCGGRGTRFREETELRPKPLIEIGGRPILWHIMKLYSHHGFRNFLLPIGYKGEMVKDYFLDYNTRNRDFTVDLGRTGGVVFHGDHEETHWRVAVMDTGLDTMTGARLSLIRPLVTSDIVMLTYGDGVADVDLNALLEFHLGHGKIGTVTGVRPPSRFGELQIQGDRVAKFAEKPQTSSGFINGGFFVFDRRIFDYVNDDRNLSFEYEPLKKLAEDGELLVYKHEGFWHPMDTYRDWQVLTDLWNNAKAPWKVW